MRNRGSGLLDLIRIKMKNLLEVSEIVDNSIIQEYLSKVENANRSDVMHWFTRERTASPNHDDGAGAGAGALGQPHVLKLANRFESYVDIENKVNAGRSINMSSQVDANASASASADESGSSACNSNAETDFIVSESNNNVVRGTMV